LKAAKKQNKDLDEDDLAYMEKKRAGKDNPTQEDTMRERD
jgi:hypothetical protein